MKVRFSQSELDQVKAICPRTELARWMREMALNPTADWVQQAESKSEISSDLMLQLSGIGNNVNQIARQLNTRANPIEAIPLLAKLAEISEQLQRLKP